MVTRRVRIRRGSVPLEEKEEGPKFSPGDLVFFAPETTVFKRLFQVREMPDENVYTIVRLTDDKVLVVDENDLSPVTEAWMRMIRAKMVYNLSTVQEWFDTHIEADATGDRTNGLLKDAGGSDNDRLFRSESAVSALASTLALAGAMTGRMSGAVLNPSNAPRGLPGGATVPEVGYTEGDDSRNYGSR
jgi:hypothetical protein